MRSETIFTVVVRDHTHLGGPMGTEYTTVIERIPCRDRFAANDEFAIAARKHKVTVLHTSGVGKQLIPDQPRINQVYDYGHVGITIQRETLR